MWTALPVAAFIDVLATIVFILFLLSALLLSVIVLLQEGKGGGLAGAFGGAGADAFGVKTGTVNKFTAWLGAAFLGLALLHAGLTARSQEESLKLEDGGSTLEGSGLEDSDSESGEGEGGSEIGEPGGSSEGTGDEGGN